LETIPCHDVPPNICETQRYTWKVNLLFSGKKFSADKSEKSKESKEKFEG